MIVNTLIDPRVSCPGGDPELLMIDALLGFLLVFLVVLALARWVKRGHYRRDS